MPRSTAAAQRAQRHPFGGPWLLHYSQDYSARPDLMVNNPADVRNAPFDGAMVRENTVTGKVFAKTTLAVSTIQTAIPSGWTTADFGDHTHNFFLLHMYSPDINPPEWESNTVWGTVATNFGNLATVLKSRGQFDGIFLDDEAYVSTGPSWTEDTYPWNWGGDSHTANAEAANGKGCLPTHTRTAAGDLVRSRGQECMNAILDAWPEAILMFAHPALLSESVGNQHIATFTPGWQDLFWAHDLKSSFHQGAIKATTTRRTGYVIDSGEFYDIRGKVDQQKSVWARKRWHPLNTTWSIPSDMRVGGDSYKLGAGGTSYDYNDMDGTPTDPKGFTFATLETHLYEAMSMCESYTWFYTEDNRFAYHGAASSGSGGAPPAGVVTALNNARTRAKATR